MNGIKRLALSLIVFAATVLPARMMAGPKVSVIGDSYSTYVNMIPSGYANYYTGGNNFVTSVNQQYWMRVVNVLGGSLEVVNAYSGSFLTLQSNNAASSMIGDARLSNLGDPDLILICAATNDSWQDLTIGEPVYHENLGDYTAEEKAQIAPAFCYLIKYLQTNKPGAEIMLVINSYDDGENRPGIKKTICDVQAEVAQHYGVMAVQCHDIRKASNHPDAEGFYTMSEQILEVYRARHRTEELVPASEYEQLATSDDPSMRVVRTEEGLAYVFTDAASAKTFTAQKDLVVLRSLVVGGGGAGGWTIGGGGAGGAVKDVRMAELPANGIVRQGETVSIQVGAGGANPYAPNLIASNTSANRILPGGNGGNSAVTFATGAITALGGGGGGSWGEQDGVSGGNGGGSAAGQVGGSGTVLNVGTVGKGSDGGYDGGAGFMSGTYDTCAPGGGAGAGGKGGDAKSGCAGNGGDAVASDILGYIEYYGGGGGGGCGNTTLTPGVPGINAGAGAEETAYIHGRNGLAGFGGGGGGGGYSATSKIDTAGGEGGSGTVILLVHELDPQAPFVSVGVASVELEAATLTLTLENVGEGAATADLYFGFALDGASRPELTKVAEGMTAGDVQQNVTGLLSSHTYRYWCIATNNLQKGSIVASGLFMTDSLIPGGIVTYSDNLIATTVAETDFDVIEIDEFRRAYVFRNTQEGKLATLARAKLARLLLVGGGAAGGTTMGGGGGGGEVKEIDLTDTPLWMAGDLATFTIGAGGAPSNTGSSWNGIGGAGGTTTLSFGEQNYSAIGGGGGASFKSTTVGSGASGGGAAGMTVTVGGVGTAGTNGGNRGKGSGQNDYSPGGGGGAASAGLAGVGVQAGAGGEGRAINITGTDVVYGSGGGGGGGNNVSPGLGGTNGGAGGGKSTDTTLDVSGQPGVDGTGSGGGGGGYNGNSKISHLGGKGGDGTVIFLFNAVEDLPFTVIEAPSHLATQELPFTGLSQRPVVPESEYYSVDYGTGDWTEAGVYTLTLSLKDPEATRWSDFSADDKVFVYTLKMMPTTSTATRIDGTTLVQTWGECYQVQDEVTGKRFQIVKATNTASAATWTVPAGVFVEYLVVGGGGAGGWTIGGGGGGGGVMAGVISPLADETEFTLYVGQGGDPHVSSTSGWPSGGNGEGSSLSYGAQQVQTHGGGGGAGWNVKTASAGASSGGNAQGSGTIVATTLYEGEMGNQGGTSSGRVSGGGGGAMEAGTNGSSVPGKGGEGYASFITGERVVYGSGGGGGLEGSATANRAKGGTNGGQGGYANVVGEDAVANTGSGGGGGGYSAATHGGAGASGIVVIRYATEASSIKYVKQPTALGDEAILYDGLAHAPNVEETEDYSIILSAGDWTQVGVYTVTLSLKDKENAKWSDGTTADFVYYTLTINPDPLDAIRPESYAGPKIAIIGDSYSAFPGTCDESHDSELGSSTTREYWYPKAANGIDNVTQMWWYQTIRDLDGYFACNDAWSGTALCEYSWGCVYGNPQPKVAVRQMCNRLEKTLPTDVEPDVVLLLAGTNDAWIRYDQNGGATSGASVIDAFIGETWADPLAKPKNHGAVMTTMKPGFAQTVWWIREKFPKAKILFIANKDQKISDNYSAALEEMAKVTGCKFLQLDVSLIEKVDGHPTASGMAELSRQVTAAYTAWAAEDFALETLDEQGEELEGELTASGDAQIGRLNTDYGYLRVLEAQGRHYAVMAVTNTDVAYEIELPAEKVIEYLAVGAGGSGGNVNNGTFAGAGGGAAVREGFHRWSGTDPVTLSVTVGAPGTTTGGGTGGKGGTTKIELSNGAHFIYADGGGAGGNWQGNGGDSEGSGGGGGSGNNERTLGGKHIGSSWLLGSDGGNGNNDSEANRSCIPGGGGGAGGPGGNSTKTVEGAGGPGVVRYITGSPVEYAAGGLGSRTKTISAAVSTGSGGSSYLGAGGSGIAAFRYELTDEEYASLMETVPHLAAKPALAATEVVYDGSDFKPGFTDCEVYTVSYSADQWIDAGFYTVTFHLRAGYTWEDDGSTGDCTLTFRIRTAENEWTTEPSISKASWLEKVDEPGVITAAAKYGEVQILYPGLATEMPTIPGDYIATVSVEGTANYTSLTVEVPFTIVMDGASRTPVAVPDVPPAGTILKDGHNHKPTVVGTAEYTVTMTEGDWVEAGVYQLVLALTDPDHTKWADETVQNRVYTYLIKPGPTMTTGTRVEGTTVSESWGEHYILCDDTTERYYQVVVVTNAGVSVDWDVPGGVMVEYLLVGGGGGAWCQHGSVNKDGGGGAGGLYADVLDNTFARTLTLYVGAGGARNAGNGENSTLKDGSLLLTALGGGAGGAGGTSGLPGINGGSGGGAGWNAAPGEALQPQEGGHGHSGGMAGTTATGWGNAWGGGGGGGAGSAGGDGTSTTGGNGGDGLQFGITGVLTWYAGGGAGGKNGVGGNGGGGDPGVDGLPNTGGGAGGGGGRGGNGGSGIAVLRYEVSGPAHPVRLPEGLASDTFAYDGTERKPAVATSRDYEVAFSAGNWTDAGVYTVTLSLTDPTCWWADDETSTDKVFTFTITQAANAWLTTPTLTKTSWREGEEAGVLSAEAKFGAWRVDYGATGETMPTEMGSYVAAVIVDETANYSGLREEIPFEIISSDAKLEVLVPSAYADTSRPYDASSCKPADVSTEQYTVSFEDANWTDAGSYTVTVALTDKEGTIWADTKTTADKTFTYTVTRASNAWVSMPTISPSAWVKGSASGVISAEPKWGVFAISFGASGAGMPTDAGEYVAQVSVQATENWEGLGPVAVPFEILGKPILGRALRVVSTEKSGGKYSSFTLSLDDKNMPGSLYIAYGDVKGGLTTNGWEQVAKVGDYEGGVAYNQIVANLPAGLGTDYRYFRFIFVPSDFDPSLYAAQEDLIAFWDGVLNDGPGKPHADAPAAWTDIIGGKPFTFTATKPAALANGFAFTGTQSGSMTDADSNATFMEAINGTVEAAFKQTTVQANASVFQGPKDSGIDMIYLNNYTLVANSISGGKSLPILQRDQFMSTSVVYGNKLANSIFLNGGQPSVLTDTTMTGITTTSALLATRGTSAPYPFKGNIYAIRLYRRALTDEERALNAHLDAFRYNDKEDELTTVTDIYNARYSVEIEAESLATAAYVSTGETVASGITPYPNNVFAGLTPTMSAGWQYTENNQPTSIDTWTDGDIVAKGAQVKNGAVITYDLPSEVSLKAFRYTAGQWNGRDVISIDSIKVEDALGNVTTILSSRIGSTAAANKAKYMAFESLDGRPIATKVKRFTLTYGAGSNNGNNIAELEGVMDPNKAAIGTPTIDVAGANGLLRQKAVGSVMGPVDRVYIRYSLDPLEVESATCASLVASLDAKGNYSALIPAISPGDDVYIRAVAMNEDEIVTTPVLAFTSVPLLLAGEGGRMYFAADGSGDLVHEFTSVEEAQAFVAPGKDVEISYLLVGGGGAGATGTGGNPSYNGKGGKGGAVVAGVLEVVANTTFTVTVGAGGAPTALVAGTAGLSGEASILAPVGGDSIVAAGGDGGLAPKNVAKNNGANGTASSITGVETYYGGGGGDGGINSVGATEGLGGGGVGAHYNYVTDCSGVDGLGGGGGGGDNRVKNPGGKGGNGIVLIRYTPPVPPVVFKLVERGPGFLRVECVINELDAPSAELSIASGADAEHLGDYQQCSAAAVVGDAFTNTVVGLNAATDWTFSAKVVTTAGTKCYTGVFTTTEAIASTVPTLADAAVVLPDAALGTVEASAFVAWGGEKSAKCELVLKYGKVSGTYTKESVISAADIGTIRSTTTLTKGIWYAVLVARSSEGESAVSQEFELYSTKPRKSTVFYLK